MRACWWVLHAPNDTPPLASLNLWLTAQRVSLGVQDTQSPQLADLQFTSLLSAYSARNLTTFVGNEQQVWTPGPGGSADAKLPFTITVHLRIVSNL